jgi:predicted anti-sigma-YlaC factor YlaD
MIPCKTVREWLPLLESEEAGMSSRKRAELEAHLQKCRECREFLDEQKRFQGMLSQSGGMQFSQEYLQDFTVRLNQRMDSSEKSKGWLRLWLHCLDVSPLPTLAQTAAVVWLVMIVAMQFPGVGPALLQVVGM